MSTTTVVAASEVELERILKECYLKNILDLNIHRKSTNEIEKQVQYVVEPLFVADIIQSQSYSSFKHVDISHISLTSDSFEVLFHAILQSAAHLETFVACHNGLTKECGSVVAKLLSHTGRLKVLDLSHNHLGDQGVAAIAAAFSAVEVADFRSNASSSSSSSAGSTMNLLRLTVLDLSSNDLSDSAVLALCKGLIQFASRYYTAASSGAASGSVSGGGSDISLSVLRLKANHISDKGALCIAQLLNAKSNSRHASLTPSSRGSRSNTATPTRSGSRNRASSFENLDSSFRLSTVTTTDLVHFRINLVELNLMGNRIGRVGTTALLGNAAEGVLSPLQVLSLSQCIGYTDQLKDVEGLLQVLSLLESNLRNSSDCALRKFVLDISSESASTLLDKYMKESAHKPMEPSFGETFQAVSDALLNLTHQNMVNLSKVRLGSFHRVLYQYCVDAQQALKGNQQELNKTAEICALLAAHCDDLTHILKAINPAANIFGVSYISNIEDWIAAGKYDYFIKSLPSATTMDSLDDSAALFGGHNPTSINEFSPHFRRSFSKEEDTKDDNYSSHYIQYGQQFTPTVSDGGDRDNGDDNITSTVSRIKGGGSVYGDNDEDDDDEAHRSMYMAIVRSASEGEVTFSSTEILSKMREENSNALNGLSKEIHKLASVPSPHSRSSSKHGSPLSSSGRSRSEEDFRKGGVKVEVSPDIFMPTSTSAIATAARAEPPVSTTIATPYIHTMDFPSLELAHHSSVRSSSQASHLSATNRDSSPFNSSITRIALNHTHTPVEPLATIIAPTPIFSHSSSDGHRSDRDFDDVIARMQAKIDSFQVRQDSFEFRKNRALLEMEKSLARLEGSSRKFDFTSGRHHEVSDLTYQSSERTAKKNLLRVNQLKHRLELFEHAIELEKDTKIFSDQLLMRSSSGSNSVGNHYTGHSGSHYPPNLSTSLSASMDEFSSSSFSLLPHNTTINSTGMEAGVALSMSMSMDTADSNSVASANSTKAGGSRRERRQQLVQRLQSLQAKQKIQEQQQELIALREEQQRLLTLQQQQAELREQQLQLEYEGRMNYSKNHTKDLFKFGRYGRSQMEATFNLPSYVTTSAAAKYVQKRHFPRVHYKVSEDLRLPGKR